MLSDHHRKKDQPSKCVLECMLRSAQKYCQANILHFQTAKLLMVNSSDVPIRRQHFNKEHPSSQLSPKSMSFCSFSLPAYAQIPQKCREGSALQTTKLRASPCQLGEQLNQIRWEVSCNKYYCNQGSFKNVCSNSVKNPRITTFRRQIHDITIQNNTIFH